MTAEIKPYPKVKDTGVQALGAIPEHWDVQKLRSLLRPVTERNRPDLPLLSVVREKGVILRDLSSKDENHNFVPDDLTNYKVVLRGQFAMNKMKAWQGSYGVSNHDGIVSPAYYVFDLGTVDGGYFHTAIRSRAYVPSLTQASDGVRIGQWDLSQTRMREIPFAVPTGPEQPVIARFLDHMDHRIQKYIRAKEKLIALLNEYKQALIHQAVTGRIDVRTGKPYPTYKPSGIDWLGEVPAHWDVRALKWVADRFQNGKTPPTSEPRHYVGGKVPWYGPSSCGDLEEVGEPIGYLSSLAFSSGKAKLMRGPTLLIVVIGSSAGRIALMPKDGSTNQQITAFEICSNRFNPSFVLRQLRLCGSRLKAMASAATIPILDSRILKRFPCVMPSFKEQTAITRFLDDAVANSSRAIDRKRREIELLREYRTRLIADVVTGKLDVREAGTALPAEPAAFVPEDVFSKSVRSRRQDATGTDSA